MFIGRFLGCRNRALGMRWSALWANMYFSVSCSFNPFQFLPFYKDVEEAWIESNSLIGRPYFKHFPCFWVQSICIHETTPFPITMKNAFLYGNKRTNLRSKSLHKSQLKLFLETNPHTNSNNSQSKVRSLCSTWYVYSPGTRVIRIL